MIVIIRLKNLISYDSLSLIAWLTWSSGDKNQVDLLWRLHFVVLSFDGSENYGNVDYFLPSHELVQSPVPTAEHKSMFSLCLDVRLM